MLTWLHHVLPYFSVLPSVKWGVRDVTSNIPGISLLSSLHLSGCRILREPVGGWGIHPNLALHSHLEQDTVFLGTEIKLNSERDQSQLVGGEPLVLPSQLMSTLEAVDCARATLSWRVELELRFFSLHRGQLASPTDLCCGRIQFGKQLDFYFRGCF